MGKTKKIEVFFFITLTLAISWVTICPVQAQVEIVSTSCTISVDNIVEGQEVTATIQMSPATPTGEGYTQLIVYLVSPNGVGPSSPNGPWVYTNIPTDPNGKAIVTFDVPTYSGYWQVVVDFGGHSYTDYSMFYVGGTWKTGLTVYPVQTPIPTPISVPTLGPLEIRSAGDEGTNVEILNIQNQSSLTNPVQILFRINALLLPYCYSSIGNTGYSVDSGTIHAVHDFINETIIHNIGDEATVWANVTLPSLSEGSHTLTVYWGWYYEGINQRYEVSAYSTVNFSINSNIPSLTPSITKEPTQTPSSIGRFADNPTVIAGIIGIVAIAAIGVTVVYLKKSHKVEK